MMTHSDSKAEIKLQLVGSEPCLAKKAWSHFPDSFESESLSNIELASSHIVGKRETLLQAKSGAYFAETYYSFLKP